LAWIFDVAGLAVHAISGADFEFLLTALFYNFVDACRAITLSWFIELRKVVGNRDRLILEFQM